MGVLRAIVSQTTSFAIIPSAQILDSGVIGSQPIGDDALRPTMPPHRFPEEFQRGFSVAGLGHRAFENLALVIDGPPEVVRLAVDLHLRLIEIPPPVAACAHPFHTFASDLGGKHRAEPVPSEPHRLVADVDATFVEQVLDLAERQGEPDVHHDRQADDLGSDLEIAEGAGAGHARRLGGRPAPLKRSPSDRARC